MLNEGLGVHCRQRGLVTVLSQRAAKVNTGGPRWRAAVAGMERARLTEVPTRLSDPAEET